MTIRRKTGVVVGVTVISLVLLLYGISRYILKSGFERMENGMLDGFLHVESDEARRNVNRVADAFDVERRNLVTKAADWAHWDDTYRFVNDHNEAYRKSNLAVSTLVSLKINCMVIVDTGGKEVFARFVENDSGYSADISPLVLLPGLKDSVVRQGGTVSGTALFNGRPLLLAALPVLTSESTGPVRGMFIIGRFVDDAFVDELASVTHLELLRNTDVENLKFASALASCGDSVCTQVVSDSVVAGKVMVMGIDDRPVMYFEVIMHRTVYQHARETLLAVRRRGRMALGGLFVSIALTGVFLCAVIFIMLELSVLRRLRLLAAGSADIGMEQTGKLRLPVDGNDEITALATAINTMLDSLQRSHAGIAERDREKRVIMNNVPVGICSLNPLHSINPEYSRVLAHMFGVTECSGMHVNELLGLDNENSELGADLLSFLDLVRRRVVPERDLAELNPLREYHYVRRSVDAWYAVSFHAAERTTEREADQLLMTVRDITEEKELSRQNVDMQRENIQLRHIAENPDYFREFMRETAIIIRNVQNLFLNITQEHVDVRTVNAMFRGVHTIKGVAGSFGLKKIESITSDLEEQLSAVQDTALVTPAGQQRISTLLALLEETFEEISRLSTSLFGNIFEEDGAVVTIPVAVISRSISELRQIAARVLPGNEQAALLCDEACIRLNAMKRVAAGKVLSRSLRMVSRLCERLGKQCRVSLNGGDVMIDYEDAQIINQMLMHLLRNALDHGIEYTAERVAKGKPEEGQIIVAVSRQNDTVMIGFSDDGRGVDREKLCAAACENGYATRKEIDMMSEQEQLEMVFRPGLSTTETMSEVSGRGVGLDMVADAVKNRLDGTISVATIAGSGTTFTIRIRA